MQTRERRQKVLFQCNADGDVLGDACDPDADNDGFTNAVDLCPLIFDDQSDLDSDGLNVDAVEAVLNEPELPVVVSSAAGEQFAGFVAHLRRGLGKNALLPLGVADIQLLKHVDEFLEHANGERARTTRRIEDGDFVDGINKGLLTAK